MKRAGVDFRAWGRFCLVTVNGFYHRCFGSLDGLYVVEGGRTGRVMNNDHVGVHSFREVGALDLIPITPEMLYKTHPNQKFSEGVNIRLPYDTEGKTVLLSIGGYLHVLDRAYRVTGSRSVKIDMANLAYVNRIYESLGKIDLSSLNLENSPNNSEQFVVAQLLSDEVISAYLCLPQSYVIVLDATDIYVRRHQLERTGLPGRYIAPMPFKPFPMISECGRVFEYRAFPEDHRMLIASETAREERLTFTTTGWQANLSVDPTVYQGVPWRIAAAEMLEFGTFG